MPNKRSNVAEGMAFRGEYGPLMIGGQSIYENERFFVYVEDRLLHREVFKKEMTGSSQNAKKHVLDIARTYLRSCDQKADYEIDWMQSHFRQ